MPDSHTIINHIPPALLVIFRIGGLMIYAPVLGSSVIPARLKVFLTFITGLAVYPLLSAEHFHGLDLKLDLWALAPLIAMELLIGLLIGYLASLPLLALQTGGLIMGQQMGLGFAQLYNPAIDDEADIVGQMLFFMAIAGFLIVGGHEWMLLAVLHSFDHLPLGGFAIDLDVLHLISGALLASLELALRVAAPVLALVFLETVAMGFLAKTVPQLNILSLGFPIRILIGIGVVALGLVVIDDVAMDSLGETFNAITHWIESSASR
jgi:flagellar biosynthetic protein FliR